MTGRARDLAILIALVSLVGGEKTTPSTPTSMASVTESMEEGSPQTIDEHGAVSESPITLSQGVAERNNNFYTTLLKATSVEPDTEETVIMDNAFSDVTMKAPAGSWIAEGTEKYTIREMAGVDTEREDFQTAMQIENFTEGFSTFDNAGTLNTTLVGASELQNVMARKVVTQSTVNLNQKDSLSYENDAILVCTVRAMTDLGSSLPLNFYTGLRGQKLAEMWKKSPSGRLMQITMRFQFISSVKEDLSWSHLCVGMYDITALTYNDDPEVGGRPVAWATLHTLSQRSVGLIRVETRCFRETIQFTNCSPTFFPLPFMANVPIFKYSVLDEEFWTNMSYSAMDVSFPWIWKINANINGSTMYNNIPPQWIYKMDIPTLDEVEIRGNNWESPDKILRPISKLAYLDLSDNNIKELPKDLLNNLPFLRNINFSYNNISEFPKEIKNLKNLTYLDLSFSQTKSPITLLRENLENLPRKLEILNLQNTRLNVNISNFFSLTSLVTLNLSQCSLQGFNSNNESTLWEDTMLNGTNLIDLDLSKNLIKTLTLKVFKKLTRLLWINLSSNQIDYIDTDIFRFNVLIRKIDLSRNALKYIPNCLFCYLNKLEVVDLSYNQLTQVPYFVNVKLSYLGLSSNYLKEFKQNDSFIESVDLSRNNISFLHISLIKKLNLSYNVLSVISYELWQNIIRLQVVDLGGNNFKCCLFKDVSVAKLKFDTKIYNLGRQRPLTCKKDQGTTEYLLGTLDEKDSPCSHDEGDESTPVEIEVVLVLAIVAVIVFCVVTLFLAYRRYFRKTFASGLRLKNKN